MTGILNDWGSAWSVWFLGAVAQNTVFLGLVLGGLFLLRRAPARVRAAVATLGVIKLAVPPFVSTGWFGTGAGEILAEPVAPLLFPFAAGPSSPDPLVPAMTGGLSRSAVLMLSWASILTARLGWSLIQWVQIYVELRRSAPVAPEEIPAEMVGSGLDVRHSERIPVPLTMGLFNRRILVPSGWMDWSPEERLAVLRHELAHIRRRDNLVLPVEVLVQAIYFFHPLVHWLIGRLRVWREMACDDLSVGRDPRLRLAYSRFLVELAETALDPGPLTESASTLMRRRCELMKRVSYQVKEGIMIPVSRLRIVPVVVFLLVAMVPLSLVHGDPPPPPPEKEAPAAPVPPESVVKAGDPARADAPPPPPPSVRVGLSDQGLTVNGDPTTQAGFSAAVKKAAAAKGGKVVVSIDSDGGVTMGRIHQMQADLLALGLQRVIYTGELGEAVPLVLPPDEAKAKLASLPADQVLDVRVDDRGVVTVEGKKVRGEDLPEIIRGILASEPYTVVALNTRSGTSYGAFLQTLQALKKGGADKIAIQDPDK